MTRILLIDDEPLVRDVLARLLSAEGHEVLAVDDGSRAVEYVEQGEIELVITDLLMPGQEGIETIGALRERWPALPILAISGGGRLDAIDLLPVARSMGATATLPKPITGTRLREAVAALAP